MSDFKSMALSIWRMLPETQRYKVARSIISPTTQRYRRAMIARPLRQKPTGTNSPLVVAGLFRTASGIGEGARSTYRSLAAEGKQPMAVCLSEAFGLVDMDSPIPLSPMPTGDSGILIVHLNSPELPKALQFLDMKRGKSSWYVIGFWAWELAVFPPDWDRNFDLVSEIWTPSSFVTKALAQHPKAPSITTMGHPIYPPDEIDPARTPFGLPENVKIYLTFADALSSLDRKNPFAAIDAFKRTHGDDLDFLLVIKTRNLSQNPGAERDLKQVINKAPNIRLMDQSLTEAEKWNLLAAADCLISLHRSEGFGLPIAEAIAIGKPVIVTAWSGNMDFCTRDNATLIDYDLVACEDRYGRYRFPGAVWAEPKTSHGFIQNVTNDRLPS